MNGFHDRDKVNGVQLIGDADRDWHGTTVLKSKALIQMVRWEFGGTFTYTNKIKSRSSILTLDEGNVPLS